MVKTSDLDSKNLTKPIIMPRNPARGQMPHALAVQDDLAARDKSKKMANYEKQLEAENKEKLQKKSDEMSGGGAVAKAPTEKAPKEETKVKAPAKKKAPVKKKANPFKAKEEEKTE